MFGKFLHGRQRKLTRDLLAAANLLVKLRFLIFVQRPTKFIEFEWASWQDRLDLLSWSALWSRDWQTQNTTRCRVVSEMTYTVSSGTLNSSIPYHTRCRLLWISAAVCVQMRPSRSRKRCRPILWNGPVYTDLNGYQPGVKVKRNSAELSSGISHFQPQPLFSTSACEIFCFTRNSKYEILVSK